MIKFVSGLRLLRIRGPQVQRGARGEKRVEGLSRKEGLCGRAQILFQRRSQIRSGLNHKTTFKIIDIN